MTTVSVLLETNTNQTSEGIDHMERCYGPSATSSRQRCPDLCILYAPHRPRLAGCHLILGNSLSLDARIVLATENRHDQQTQILKTDSNFHVPVKLFDTADTYAQNINSSLEQAHASETLKGVLSRDSKKQSCSIGHNLAATRLPSLKELSLLYSRQKIPTRRRYRIKRSRSDLY